MDGRFDDNDWEEARLALDGLKLKAIEVKVARLVSCNRKNDRIAKDLGITVSKVKWILRGVFIKFGVEDRHALADAVGSRLAALRKSRGRRLTALQVLKKPRRARRKAGPADAGEGDSRYAPPA